MDRESTNRESTNRESTNRESTNRESMNSESMNSESMNFESMNPGFLNPGRGTGLIVPAGAHGELVACHYLASTSRFRHLISTVAGPRPVQ
jgi:hypothetical protein